ncbi:MAG: pyrimidine-nucleoside phosphorylase [Thermosediminibacterales bacterium]|nr:pyrimidine-nucleoside phosphorylase [Thermosediminibacterales bacterium]
MRAYDIILKKRNGRTLSFEELNFMVKGYVDGKIPDYQVSAFLMAVFFRGLNETETFDLTKAMLETGDKIDLSEIKGIKVDKHSTGGVGDKTTLIIGPLVASTGLFFAKMSGRGLGHTGGTIDKLESIPGFNVNLTIEKFIENVKRINIAIASQTKKLVVADKKLYALRDVTATVDDISLIASSIMSKKLASGSDVILLDVKVGSGAFMKDVYDAEKLAKLMIKIGCSAGKKTVALLTNMDQPLGKAVGNSLEVIEAIETLKGKGPKDLEELCINLAGNLIFLGNKAKSLEEGIKTARKNLKNGNALKTFSKMIKAQDGDPSVIEDYKRFPKTGYSLEVKSPEEGYIYKIDAESIGLASVKLGAGRNKKGEKIDLASGIVLHKKVGDYIKVNETIATLYSNNEAKIQEISKIFLHAYKFSNTPPVKQKLIIKRIEQ